MRRPLMQESEPFAIAQIQSRTCPQVRWLSVRQRRLRLTKPSTLALRALARRLPERHQIDRLTSAVFQSHSIPASHWDGY